MYKADSKIAEEFINHQEILDTMSYAETHKSNRALIESLIDKAARCKGLTHREAALLLECDQPDLIERIFRLAEEIKHKFLATALSCSLRYIFPIIVSMVAYIVLIT